MPIKSLVVHEPETSVPEETLIHTKRIGKVYGVKVEEEIVEGNPNPEFVREVRAMPNQLVLLDWDCPTLRKDILRKIIHDAEPSVLLMK
ncbi:MAG: hypothetical protein AB1665_04650 [Candidatus Thermoplasmatota archaeon]